MKQDMSTLRKTEQDIGTKMPFNERAALWAILAMIIYLVIAQ